MGAVKIYLSQGDLNSYLVPFGVVNKTKCTRNAQFPKTGLYEDQAGSNHEIYSRYDAACQRLPVASYKSSYLL